MRLHLLNAVATYGLRKPSFIAAYLTIYVKRPTKDWRAQYKGMIREYVKNRSQREGIKEYFRAKRAQVIARTIEKKRREKARLIERMLYGYDNLESSGSDCESSAPSSTSVASRGAPDLGAQEHEAAEWSVESFKPLSNSLKHLANLSHLPPPLELPGQKDQLQMSLDLQIDFEIAQPACQPWGKAPAGEVIEEEAVFRKSRHFERFSKEEQELEQIFCTLDDSDCGASISSMDAACLERFFKWTLDRVPASARPKSEGSGKEPEAGKLCGAAHASPGMFGGKSPCILKTHAAHASADMRDYYSLDFHEYPRKRSPRDRSRWGAEYPTVLRRVRTVSEGRLQCPAHRPHKKEAETAEDKENQQAPAPAPAERKASKKRARCIRCFDADMLEEELGRDQRPSMAEYVFRAMLFLQMVLFSDPPGNRKEAEAVKNELYKFYEYYRK